MIQPRPLTLFVFSMLLGVLPAEAARDCRGRLQFDEPYECEFRSDLSAAAIDGSLLFEEFDGNAFVARLSLLGDASKAYCTCKTSQPNRFDRAKAFECVSGFAPSVAETFEGNVTGNGGRIDKGQLWSSDPAGGGFARFIFGCSATSEEEDSDLDSDADDDSDGDDSEEDDDSDAGDKVVLCHKGKKTLEVPAAAVQQHLDHGDELGACD